MKRIKNKYLTESQTILDVIDFGRCIVMILYLFVIEYTWELYRQFRFLTSKSFIGQFGQPVGGEG